MRFFKRTVVHLRVSSLSSRNAWGQEAVSGWRLAVSVEMLRLRLRTNRQPLTANRFYFRTTIRTSIRGGLMRIVRIRHLLLILLVAGSATAADGGTLQGVQIGDIDRKADPCTDFFQY